MTKAYSYLRISTERQLSGDGIRRQLEASKKYAEQHGWTLVETLQDIGVSAFKGKNAKEGALGLFIAAIDEGKIPQGSVLIVESLDRLSRDNVLTAFNQFSNILGKGVGIVTLTDGAHYTSESVNKDFSQIIISLTVMMRANEESATKSKRIRAAFARKRQNVDNEKLTANTLSWLTLNNDRKGFDVNEDKAQIVREIYKLCIDGMGVTSITKHLNMQRDKYPPITDSKVWYDSYVGRLLRNPAVHGEFQSKEFVGNKKVKRGDPVPDYFPVIVPKDLFELARARMTSRTTPRSAGAKGNTYSNLFTGLVTCSQCGGNIMYKNKGKPPKGYKYLRCYNSLFVNGCNAPAWRYDEFESSFMDFVREVNFSDVLDSNDNSQELRDIEGKIASARSDLSKARTAYDALISQFEVPELPETLIAALVKRSIAIQAEIESLEDQIEAFENRKVELSQANVSADQKEFLQAYDEVLKTKDDVALRELRFSMAGLLRKMVSKIELHNSMFIEPWEAVDMISEQLGQELFEEGIDTESKLEEFFSKPSGRRKFVESERYYRVIFNDDAKRVVYPYLGISTKTVIDRIPRKTIIRKSPNNDSA